MVVLAALAASLAACRGDASPVAPCPDCNVVVISVDTLRADHVGALGYGRPTTPEIDALARRGVLFENAISQSSWTRPAHMSIFTGLFPREHGFVALRDSRRLEDTVPTLAGVLRDHGFQTAAFTGGVNLAATYGFDRGFDTYRTNGKYFRDNLEDTRYWLDHERTGRFFLFLHGYDAHTPYLTDAVDRHSLELPPSRPEGSLGTTCKAEGPVSRIRPFLDEYDGAVHRADRYVGKLVRELEARGLLDRTILVVLSDHGEEFLEHGRCFHIATVHRESVHVPLLVVAPQLEPRRVREPVAASVTIAPTIMELLGIDEHPFPAPSLVVVARGGAAPDAPIVSETERNAEKKGDGYVRALTTTGHRLFEWTTRGGDALYDAVADPAEQHALEDPELRRTMLSQLTHWADAHPSRFAPRRSKSARQPGNDEQDKAAGEEVDPEAEREQRERERELRSLGYVE